MKKLKILICVNGAAASKVAFKFGCAYAKAIKASVDVLNVVDSMDIQNPFTSDIAKEEEQKKADALLTEYVNMALDECPGLIINTTSLFGVFDDTVIKTVSSDGDIGMIVLGYSSDANVKSHTATSLLAKLGKTLMVPLMVVPGNLTNHQIVELTNEI